MAVLKGGALLVEDPAVDNDLLRAREMYDLDVLVSPADHAHAVAVLKSAGYQRAPMSRFEPDHALTFRKEGEAGLVDLHRALGSNLPFGLMPVEDVLGRSLPATVLGAAVRILPPADVLVHDVWHSEVADLNYRVGGLPVRQLFGFTQLFDGLATPEVWREVRDRFEAAGLSAVLAAHCELARHLFRLDISDPGTSVAAAAAASSTRRLWRRWKPSVRG